MTQQSRQSMYFGGIPTDPDVRKLRDQYPEHNLEVGQEMPYSEVEQLIGTKKDTKRFRTVTNRWRKIVSNETSHVIGTKPGEGFVVLSESEKLDMAEGKLRSAWRHAHRSSTVSGKITAARLTDEEKERKLHLDNINTKTQETIRLAAKNELPSLTE